MRITLVMTIRTLGSPIECRQGRVRVQRQHGKLPASSLGLLQVLRLLVDDTVARIVLSIHGVALKWHLGAPQSEFRDT